MDNEMDVEVVVAPLLSSPLLFPSLFNKGGLWRQNIKLSNSPSLPPQMKRDIWQLVSAGFYGDAFSLYIQLFKTQSNHLLNTCSFTYPTLLKACQRLLSPSQTRLIHTHVLKTGFCSDVYTATSLISTYMKLHLLDDANKVFEEMRHPNLASVNAQISGLSQNGYHKKALLVFKNLGIGDFVPNSVTVASVLSACEMVEHGLQVHGCGVKLGVDEDVYVATALLTMYVNCGELISGLKVFQSIPDKNVVSYNALVTGLLKCGLPHRVLNMFKAMREYLDERPSSVTWVSVFSACSELLNIQFGKQVHGLLLKSEVGHDVKVGTALVDMYSKCGCWKSGYGVFNDLGCTRNLITWNSMISGMMLNGQYDNAVELFKRLESEGLAPDSASWNSMISGFSQQGKGVKAFSFFNKMQLAGEVPSLKSITSLLPACSAQSDFRSGKEIHGYTIRTAVNSDEFISTALIDMYMKCGFSSLARRVFDQFDRKPDDPAFWNVMISGYGRHGESERANEIFELMEREGVKPNSGTFTGILSAYSHAGKVEKALECFRMITRHYGAKPTSEHFGCIVDLLGRAGELNKARDLIHEIPGPLKSVYSSLLGACRSHLDVELGEEIAQKLLELEPEDPTPFVILSNIYVEMGRRTDAEMVREMIMDKGLCKRPGLSTIGVGERVACNMP